MEEGKSYKVDDWMYIFLRKLNQGQPVPKIFKVSNANNQVYNALKLLYEGGYIINATSVSGISEEQLGDKVEVKFLGQPIITEKGLRYLQENSHYSQIMKEMDRAQGVLGGLLKGVISF